MLPLNLSNNWANFFLEFLESSGQFGTKELLRAASLFDNLPGLLTIFRLSLVNSMQARPLAGNTLRCVLANLTARSGLSMSESNGLISHPRKTLVKSN